MGHYLRALYLGSSMPFRVHLGFHRRDLNENSQLALSTLALQTKQVWLRLVVIHGDFTSGAMCLFGLFLEGLWWKFTPRILHACAKHDAGCDPSIMTFYLENDVPFGLNHAFHCRDSPKNTCLSLSTNEVSLGAIGHYLGNFTWRTKYRFDFISASIRGTFLKIHTPHSACMCYTHRRFGCERSIINDTLLGEQRVFSVESRLPLEGFSLTFIPRTF
jgi:hypothetical protein